MLPKPDCVFTIPSLHDGLELDGRLYFPRQLSKGTKAPIRACAIVAHPYAPLGGCWDDPVLQSIGSTLLKLGVVVNTFNFRGAVGSPGRTSWTGNAELADYVSMMALMLRIVNSQQVRNYLASQVLILGGYSYGSLIASCVPNIEALELHMNETQASPLMKEIALRATELSQPLSEFIRSHVRLGHDASEVEVLPASPRGVVMGGYETASANKDIHRDSFRRSFESVTVRRSIDRVKQKFTTSEDHGDQFQDRLQTQAEASASVAFLLVSPILPPVASFITLFSRPTFTCGQHKNERSKDQQRSNLSNHPVLLIFGSKDMFTSSHQLKRWSQEVESLPQSRISYEEIDGAGHFWREPGVELRLQGEISTWCIKLLKESEQLGHGE